MKKLFLYLALATGLFAADAANDIVLSQRKADNSGFIQRNLVPTANAALGVDANKLPVALTGIQQDSATGAITLTAGGAAKSISLLPSTTGGIGIGVAGSTGQRIKQYGASVVTTPVEATWWTSANPGLFGGFSEGTGSGAGDWIFSHASASGNGTNQIFRKARGTLASPAAVAQDDAGGGFIGSFYDGTAFRNTASIQFLAESAATTNVAPGYILFQTGETTGRNGSVGIKGNGALVVGWSNKTTSSGLSTLGIQFRTGSPTYTDGFSSGTVASAVANSFNGVTFAASSATTYTNAANVFIASDVAAGANVTATNSYGLWNVGKTRLDGNVTFGGVMITSTDTLSGAGAVSVTKDTTKLTSSGVAQAITLANGVDGQIKRIIHDVDGGSMILTPTTKTGWSTATFTNVGESLTLEYVSTRGWIVLSSYLTVVAP